MPTLDTVAQSVSRINAQKMSNANKSQPVISFSSGGINFYHQNPFSTAIVVNQPSKQVLVPLQQHEAPMLISQHSTIPIYPSNSLTPPPSAHVSQTNHSFNVKDLADAITSSHLNF